MTRIGILGLGFMAATHIKAYRQIPEASIVALCNPSGRHLDGDFSKVAGNIGTADPLRLDMTNIKAYREIDRLLADPDIDVIDICAPTVTHLELASAALRSGKHVLCEKPLARTSQQARAIADIAASAKGFFMPAMCLRFWPEWAWLKQAIASGEFGRVRSARFRRVAEPPGWGHTHFADGSKSGGALLDLHIHDADFVRYCFGEPTGVFASGYSCFSGAIDHVVAQYDVEGGAMVFAEGAWAMTPGFGFNMAYTAVFENATADYDISRGADALKLYEPGKPGRTVTCEGPDGYVRELRHFLESVQTGNAPSVVTAEDGVRSVTLCEAEETSIRTRTRIVPGR